MAINIAKAEASMKNFSNRQRTTKSFNPREVVKVRTRHAARSYQRKLQPRVWVTEVVRSLGKDNYEIRFLGGSSIHPIVHAEKLGKF